MWGQPVRVRVVGQAFPASAACCASILATRSCLAAFSRGLGLATLSGSIACNPAQTCQFLVVAHRWPRPVAPVFPPPARACRSARPLCRSLAVLAYRTMPIPLPPSPTQQAPQGRRPSSPSLSGDATAILLRPRLQVGAIVRRDSVLSQFAVRRASDAEQEGFRRY